MKLPADRFGTRRPPRARVLCLALLVTLGCRSPEPIPDLALHRGRNALTAGRYDWARIYFEEDLRVYPRRPESLRGLGIAWISGYEGSLTLGIEALTEYLDLVPADPAVRLQLARSWHRLGRTDRVVEALRDAPESLEANVLLALAFEESEPEAAATHAAEALALDPTAVEALTVAARLADRTGDSEAALAHASSAVAADPLRASSHYLLGRLRLAGGASEQATRDLETYRGLRRFSTPDPGARPSPREELRIVRELKRRFPRAAPLLRREAQLLLVTGSDEVRPAVAEILTSARGGATDHLETARLAHDAGRIGLARDLYRRALELDPELAPARAGLARLEHDAGNGELARQLVESGLELDAYYAEYHFTAGLLELSGGREAEASDALARAVDLVPWLVPYRLALADVYLAAGRREELARLIDLAPSSDPALEAFRERYFGP